MRGINSTYLGWGNPRSAFLVEGHDIVILTDADKSAVLQGEAAIDFRRDMSDLNNHLCGIRSSAEVAKILAGGPANDPHDLHAYNSIFDRYFDAGPDGPDPHEAGDDSPTP